MALIGSRNPSNPILCSLRTYADTHYQLHQHAAGVVKSRNGAVLSRGFMLKSDQRPSAPSSGEVGGGVHLAGATNFRMAELGVFGVAQPTEAGLRTILSVLKSKQGRETVWFCTREEPLVYIGSQVSLGDVGERGWDGADCCGDEAFRAEGRRRADEDVCAQRSRREPRGDRAEARSHFSFEDVFRWLRRVSSQAQAGHHQGGGAVWRCHSRARGDRQVGPFSSATRVKETHTSSAGDQEIRNTWVAADQVRTVREVWEEVAAEGYNVSLTPQRLTAFVSQCSNELFSFSQLVYHRIPVTRDQSPEDRYLDTYAEILASTPTTSSLVFNCGIGVVRTTFAMCAALIVRRRQMLLQGMPDPYGIVEDGKLKAVGENAAAVVVLRARSEQAIRDQSLLRLMHVLQKSAFSFSFWIGGGELIFGGVQVSRRRGSSRCSRSLARTPSFSKT